jgi:transposase, IS30 family
MDYKRLTREERYQISALLKSGIGVRAIARNLGRSPSTISREINKKKSNWNYVPRRSHREYLERRSNIHPPRVIEGRIKSKVESMLKKQWSPEQICGQLAKEKIYLVHETIYQYIYREFRHGRKIYLNCRRKRKYRRTRLATFNYKNKTKRQVPSFSSRPKIVDKRSRIGDWERDTIVSKPGGKRLLTIVDRVTRYTKISLVSGCKASVVHKSTVHLLRNLPVKTITNDNGQEFKDYHLTEKSLKTKIYFNDPYCSWQRGTNENTNGLIRQYFPKRSDFELITDKDVKRVENLLNNRPRKCLGYKTPKEVQKKRSKVLR